MKRKVQIAGRIAASIMAAAMTVTSLPVSAAAMSTTTEEQTMVAEQTTESGETAEATDEEKGAVLQEEAAETLDEETLPTYCDTIKLNGVTASATKVTNGRGGSHDVQSAAKQMKVSVEELEGLFAGLQRALSTLY